jgi:hypothetical protein
MMFIVSNGWVTSPTDDLTDRDLTDKKFSQ